MNWEVLPLLFFGRICEKQILIQDFGKWWNDFKVCFHLVPSKGNVDPSVIHISINQLIHTAPAA